MTVKPIADDGSSPLEPPVRFCGRCGVSLIPLEGSHLSSNCEECGLKRYYVRTGDGGVGLKVEKGENITVQIPPISLKPGPSKFFRPGLAWFLRMQFFPPGLRDRSIGLEPVAKALEEEFDAVHRASSILADQGIEFDEPPEAYDFGSYFEAIKGNEDLPELWAFHGSLHLQRMKSELEAGNTDAALYSMHAATRCSAVLRTFGDIEETLWRGYQWNLKVFEVSGVKVGDPATLEALEQLAQKLETISLVALYDLVKHEGGLSQKLALSALSDGEIRNVVQFVWESRQKKDELERADSRLAFDTKNMAAVAIVAIAVALISGIFSLLGMWLFSA